MKPIIFLALFLSLSVVSQSQELTPGQVQAASVAARMKDTLDLSVGQFKSIYQVNLDLLARKKAARQQYANRDSLTVHIQRIENKRDTLYAAVLNASQYQVYKQKKTVLISAH